MATVRFKATVIGSGIQQEGIPTGGNPPTIITYQGGPTIGGQQGFYNGIDNVLTNVASAISALPIGGSLSVYMTTSGTDKTAIEAAVTIVPASSTD